MSKLTNTLIAALTFFSMGCATIKTEVETTSLSNSSTNKYGPQPVSIDHPPPIPNIESLFKIPPEIYDPFIQFTRSYGTVRNFIEDGIKYSCFTFNPPIKEDPMMIRLCDCYYSNISGFCKSILEIESGDICLRLENRLGSPRDYYLFEANLGTITLKRR